jgi:hypothetical protein
MEYVKDYVYTTSMLTVLDDIQHRICEVITSTEQEILQWLSHKLLYCQNYHFSSYEESVNLKQIKAAFLILVSNLVQLF